MNAHLVRRLAVIVLSVVLLMSGLPPRLASGNTLPAPTLAAPTASIDWTMERRLGFDSNNDGVIDVQNDTAGPVFHVTLNACASTGAIIRYDWTIEGQAPASSAVCSGPTRDFPEEGLYTVILIVTQSDGQTAQLTRDIVIQDWLIVAIGDSIGSGEGNPDIPIPPTLFEQWLNADLAVRTALHDFQHATRELSDATNAADASKDLLDCLLLPTFSLNPAPLCIKDPSEFVAHVNALNTQLIALGRDTIDATANPFSIIDTVSSLVDTLSTLKDDAQSIYNSLRGIYDAAVRNEALIDAGIHATWQNQRCHRSSLSGQAKAAQAIEDADPRTTATLVHLSCSGAGIKQGLLEGYEGQEPASPNLDPQVDRAVSMIGGREVDAVFLSIGANDAHFSNIVKDCIVQEPCNSTQFRISGFDPVVVCDVLGPIRYRTDCENYGTQLETAASGSHNAGPLLLLQGLAPLPDRYAQLNERLKQAFPAIARDPSRVFITFYPNTTQDESGANCGNATSGRDAPGITPEEWAWARQSVTGDGTIGVGLNGGVAAAAALYRWTLVGGVYGDFATHGYCSRDNWIVRLQDAFFRQGNPDGAFHPNGAGQDDYAQRLRGSLLPTLYAGGDLRSPRLPAPNELARHSLQFDGATAFAEASGTKLNLTSDWTVELWFKDDDPSGGFNHENRQLIHKGDRDASPEAPYFILVGHNHLLGGVRTGGRDYPIDFDMAYAGLDPKLWHHVALHLNAAQNVLNLWVDGVHRGYLVIPGHSTVGNTLPVQIGRNGPLSGKYWLGEIDDVRIWSVARKGNDIAANYKREVRGANPDGLVANWRFNESSGRTVLDGVSPITNATLGGAASFTTVVHP